MAAALAGALVLAGCATVPTKGPIRSGSQAGLAQEAPGLGIEAQPPRENAKPLAIVNGFLEAMSDSRAFDVARQYMTPEAAASWKPETKISVYDQSSTKAVSLRPDGQTVELKAPLIATIDERGSWTPAPRGAVAQFIFKLAKVSDQNRVSVAPPGVFLGSNQLEPKLTPRALYFFTPARDMLVPDPLYLPNNLPPGQAATQLIQELLKGPTARLGNGVVSAAPPGTEVNVSVPVDLGVATVALSDAAAALGEDDRKLLAAQIAWTLRPISARVRITVGGAALLPEEPDILPFGTFSQYDPAVSSGQLKELYGVRNGKIQHISGLDGSGPIEAKPLDESELYGYDADSFAVDLSTDFGAIVTRVGGSEVVAYGRLAPKDKNDKVMTIPTDGDVLRPTFDAHDNLWILDRADSTTPRLRVRGKDGKVSEVKTNFSGDSPLVLRMAPDGVRALLVMQKKGSTETLVQTGTIAANEAKQPVLGQFRRLELPLTGITDAAWNQLGILVAGRSGKGATRQPWQVNTDGSQPRLIPGANFEASAVASNPNIDTLPVVQDVQDQLHWQAKDLSWPGMTDEAQSPGIDPVYPG